MSEIVRTDFEKKRVRGFLSDQIWVKIVFQHTCYYQFPVDIVSLTDKADEPPHPNLGRNNPLSE